MSKLFQIKEDDLADLEKIVPEIVDSFMEHLTPRIRVQSRRCQSILSTVRWKYGPPTVVEIIPCDDSDSDI